jgi:hypothetical protein
MMLQLCPATTSAPASAPNLSFSFCSRATVLVSARSSRRNQAAAAAAATDCLPSCEAHGLAAGGVHCTQPHIILQLCPPTTSAPASAPNLSFSVCSHATVLISARSSRRTQAAAAAATDCLHSCQAGKAQGHVAVGVHCAQAYMMLQLCPQPPQPLPVRPACPSASACTSPGWFLPEARAAFGRQQLQQQQQQQQQLTVHKAARLARYRAM